MCILSNNENIILKKAILSITIVAVCFSCNNRGTGKASESDHAIEDSIKQLSLIRQQDSINRERIFDELGDTVFGKVCFGMNKTQYRKAFNEFKKPLKNDKDYYDFDLAGYEFRGDEGSDVEKNSDKTIDGYPYGLENILKEDRLWTYFYKDRLFSIRWDSWRDIQDEDIVKYSIGKIIALFEKKYGKPNVNNTDIFNHSYIETGAWHQMKVIARWETGKKKIIIFYRDLVGSERDKWMEDNYPSYYQYELIVQFLDKTIKSEVDEYIKPILQKFADDYKEKMRQDSIKNANAL
jgi:hypothetical protein